MNDSKLNDLKNKKVKFIVCEILYDEIKEKLPSGWDVIKYEKRLHEKSDTLRETLQKEIDISQDYDVIILGYALCGKSVEGLISPDTYLIIPKCDDCIALLLGSVEEYKKQFSKEPGTYYLTRGYIGETDNPIIGGFAEIRDKYDEATWKWIIKEMLKNYKRLAYINTGNYEPGQWRKLAMEEAIKLDLAFEEIEGTNKYFEKLLNSDWDDDFLIIEPGSKIKLEMFMNYGC